MEPMITFETIRAAHRTEREEQMGKLADGFFRAARQWLSYKKSRGDTNSLLEAESAKKLLEEIINRRQRKIVFAALGSARGAAPPQNMTAEEASFFDRTLALMKVQQNEAKENLFGADFTIEQKMEEARKSVEEMKAPNTVLEKTSTPRPLMEAHPLASTEVSRPDINSQPVIPDQNPLKPLNNTKKVRILIELPCFVDMTGNRYGPFKAGDTAEVPKDVLELLTMRRAAELTA